MATQAMCGWCHAMGQDGGWCLTPGCGHEVGASRLACRCSKCMPDRPAAVPRVVAIDPRYYLAGQALAGLAAHYGMPTTGRAEAADVMASDAARLADALLERLWDQS